MNSEFFSNGKKYISAKRASKLTGYAQDYIGQLARAGKLDSQLIGRNWFVHEESLLGYKKEVVESEYKGKKRGRKPKNYIEENTALIAVEIPLTPVQIPELVVPEITSIRIADVIPEPEKISNVPEIVNQQIPEVVEPIQLAPEIPIEITPETPIVVAEVVHKEQALVTPNLESTHIAEIPESELISNVENSAPVFVNEETSSPLLLDEDAIPVSLHVSNYDSDDSFSSAEKLFAEQTENQLSPPNLENTGNYFYEKIESPFESEFKEIEAPHALEQEEIFVGPEIRNEIEDPLLPVIERDYAVADMSDTSGAPHDSEFYFEPISDSSDSTDSTYSDFTNVIHHPPLIESKEVISFDAVPEVREKKELPVISKWVPHSRIVKAHAYNHSHLLKPNFVQAAGMFLLRAAVVVVLIFIIRSDAAVNIMESVTSHGGLGQTFASLSDFEQKLSDFYPNIEAGGQALGRSIRTTGASISDFTSNSSEYFTMGVQDVGKTVADSANSGFLKGGSNEVAAVFDANSWKTFFAHPLQNLAIAVYDGLNSLLTNSVIEVHVDKLATNGDTTNVAENSNSGNITQSGNSGGSGVNVNPTRGVAVIPSTGNSKTDAAITDYVQQSFSDQVEVVSHDKNGDTGVVRPVFKNRTGDDYLYVLVPVNGNSPP